MKLIMEILTKLQENSKKNYEEVFTSNVSNLRRFLLFLQHASGIRVCVVSGSLVITICVPECPC